MQTWNASGIEFGIVGLIVCLYSLYLEKSYLNVTVTIETCCEKKLKEL